MQLGTDRPDAPAVKARSRRGLGQGRWKMTSEHPWRLQDLEYEPAGGGRERATIGGVEIVRVNGKCSITSPYGQWRDKDEKEVYAVLHYLYRKRGWARLPMHWLHFLDTTRRRRLS